ncbi:iron-sulfur cluster assembly scaffold protein [Desulfobacterales bacterium HSG17]|nr:iron-sulfur cluster assembly scaffold protein [Desulfobacterales bacterium HSG17]
MNADSFDFWRDHSDRFLEMACLFDYCEKPLSPDGFARKTRDCGDTIEFYITVNGAVIEHISFIVQGCMNTMACANTIVRLIQGKTITEAWHLTPETVSQYLKTLPKDHFHCAEHSCETFYKALQDLELKKKEPWRKAYTSNK